MPRPTSSTCTRPPRSPRRSYKNAVRAAGPAYAAAGVSLTTDVQATLADLEVDRDRLAEVLANLLANSRRHTPRDGRVQVSARQDGHHVEIAIADNGEGIAAEHIERIFERFYRVDPARSRASGGTGIGLAIARAIVQAHGGTVTASSNGAEHGATFTVRLPTRDPRHAV